MSLRDFNMPSSDDPIALHNAPLGNGAGLDSFHTVQPEDIAPNNTPKIIGALAVALMVGTAGVALYTSAGSSSHPKPMVVASNLPAPPPAAPAAMTPAPDANMPASTPAASTDTAPAPVAPVKPVKTASVARHKTADASADTASSDAASARMAADSNKVTNQPQQHAAVATPSPSDIATNKTQSGVAVPQSATTASDIPTSTAQNGSVAPQQAQSSTPQASNAGPAQDQQTGATPAPAQAPAQSAGQVNQ
jgi:hypothetical protein